MGGFVNEYFGYFEFNITWSLDLLVRCVFLFVIEVVQMQSNKKTIKSKKGGSIMEFTSILFGIIFLIIGILFSNGKIHVNLSFWKNMENDEKARIKIMPLCRNIGKVITLAALIFLINGIFQKSVSNWFSIMMIGWMLIAGIDVWYIEKSNRYKN